jgi:ribosome-associated translation inhibitor RaiA
MAQSAEKYWSRELRRTYIGRVGLGLVRIERGASFIGRVGLRVLGGAKDAWLLNPEGGEGGMKIILSGVGFKTSEPLRVYAEHRVVFWLGPLEHRLDVVTVQLANEDHPEGRRSRCRLLARPVAGPRFSVDLVVEEASTDVYEAIDRAPESMARAFELATRKRRRPVQAGV